MAWVLLALGLVFIVEGLVYVLAPSVVERILALLRSLSESERRNMGLLAIVSGAILVWLAFAIGLPV